MFSRSDWAIVAGLSMICFVGMGATISTIGLFFNPIQADFGWNSEQVSGLATSFLAAMSLFALIVGALLDRFNPRNVIAAATLIAAAGCAWSSVAEDRWTLLLAFALTGAGIGASTYVPSMFVAAKRFSVQLGLVIGIILAAASAGSALLPPLVAATIEGAGWRTALLLIAGLLILTATPAALLAIPDRRLLDPAPGRHAALADMARWRTILISPVFWCLCLTQCLFFIGFMGLYLHVVPFLLEVGYPLQHTAWIFGAVNGVSTIGLVAVGWVADRMGAQRILIWSLVLDGASIFLLDLLHTPQHQVALFAFILLWGLTQGVCTQLVPMLLAESFGTLHYGKAAGVLGVVHGASTAAGPLVVGIVYDATGNYRAAFHLTAVLVLLAAVPALFVPHWFLRRHAVAPPSA